MSTIVTIVIVYLTLVSKTKKYRAVFNTDVELNPSSFAYNTKQRQPIWSMFPRR